MHRSKSKASSEASKESSKDGETTTGTDNDELKDNEDIIKQQRLLTECNICLDIARDAVISMCGHLFCWPCLHQWLYATDSNLQSHKTCPVCKSAISREKVIPIYGRDQSNRQDPRDRLPPRPAGQWTEVPSQNQFPYGNVWAMGGPGAQIFGFGDGGFHMSFGIGSLPQYILAFLHEYTTTDRANETDFFLMKFFAICGIFCIILTLYFC